MKILAFVDLHSDFMELEKIKRRAKKEKVELILMGGDLTIFGSELRRMMKELDKVGVPVLIIHGNHELLSEMRTAQKGLKNVKEIHKKIYRKDNVVVLGYGGGGFTLTDTEFAKTMKGLMKKVKKEDKVILLTHQPPYGTKVDKIHGSYAGNKTTRNFIKKEKPLLVVCGHLHENEGKKDKIGKTKIINPGYQGMILEI